jgi:hypothetical protein
LKSNSWPVETYTSLGNKIRGPAGQSQEESAGYERCDLEGFANIYDTTKGRRGSNLVLRGRRDRKKEGEATSEGIRLKSRKPSLTFSNVGFLVPRRSGDEIRRVPRVASPISQVGGQQIGETQ